MDKFIEKDQHIRFSGAGAAHQNGVAKRGTQTVIRMSRTMLMNFAMRSPQVTITTELWPMAIDQAVWLYNWMPREDSDISTYEICIRSYFLPRKDIMPTFHIWGYPAYII